ncbi:MULTISPECIES: hypothetical protein [unclassified Paenibacillus]|uniref:hypothetical protein n=1 Tax=unclassified Paenibacillus TaxID=185978 RepID=UPI00096FCEFA|nr:hypothetical protein BJP48_30105 [Paenibacillus odorifer]
MQTYEDFFKEQAVDIETGNSKVLYDADAEQLMVVVKQKRTFFEEFRSSIRESDSLGSMAFHVEGKHNIIGVELRGLTQDKILNILIPLGEVTIPAFKAIASTSKFLHVAIVTDDLQEVYGLGVFKDQMAKMALSKKLDDILSI